MRSLTAMPQFRFSNLSKFAKKNPVSRKYLDVQKKRRKNAFVKLFFGPVQNTGYRCCCWSSNGPTLGDLAHLGLWPLSSSLFRIPWFNSCKLCYLREGKQSRSLSWLFKKLAGFWSPWVCVVKIRGRLILSLSPRPNHLQLPVSAVFCVEVFAVQLLELKQAHLRSFKPIWVFSIKLELCLDKQDFFNLLNFNLWGNFLNPIPVLRMLQILAD